jgi:thioredoxin 1
VILYYTATWCGPCQAIAPIYEKLSSQHKDIVFAKIDIDTLREAAEFAQIRSVPTFQFRYNGKKVSEVEFFIT